MQPAYLEMERRLVLRHEFLDQMLKAIPILAQSLDGKYSFMPFGFELRRETNYCLIIPRPIGGQNFGWMSIYFRVEIDGVKVLQSEAELLKWVLESAIRTQREFALVSDHQNYSAGELQVFLQKLTYRQTKILSAICDGKSNSQIASQFHLSESMIKIECRKIYHLFDVRKRAELIEKVQRQSTHLYNY